MLIPQTAELLAAEEHEQGRGVVIILDEAHLLGVDQWPAARSVAKARRLLLLSHLDHPKAKERVPMDPLQRALDRLSAQEETAHERAGREQWAQTEGMRLVRLFVQSLVDGGATPLRLVLPTFARENYQVRNGTWYTLRRREEHRWNRADTEVGAGWPITWTGPYTVVPSFTRNRDETVPARVSLGAVVYSPSDDMLRCCVVDQVASSDEVPGYNGEGAQHALHTAKVALVEPRVYGELCDDTGCGLPRWVVERQVPWTEGIGHIYISAASQTVETGHHQFETLEAPSGRGDDAFRWFLGRTLSVLDEDLKVRGLRWSGAR